MNWRYSKFTYRICILLAVALAAILAASAGFTTTIGGLLMMLVVAGSYPLLQRFFVHYAPALLLQNRSGPHAHFSVRTSNLAMPVDHLQSVLDAGGIGTWKWQCGSAAITGDEKASQLAGLGPGTRQKPAMAILKNIDAEDRKQLLSSLREGLAKPQQLSLDIRFKCFDGKARWLAVRGTSARGVGAPAGFTGIVYDVTEQKAALAKTDALLREVSHRTKNLLALILAMARLTARDNIDVKTHLKQFALRVAGLSASQDVIVAADWQSADLGALALGEIEAVARTNAQRISISGPQVAVTPEAAQTLGIIITELTLNAVEHGALSVPAGQVQLSWEVPDDATFRMSWKERGGIPYDPAKPKRYGMTIVERLAVQGLRATLSFGGGQDGFEWTLETSLPSIGASPRAKTA